MGFTGEWRYSTTCPAEKEKGDALGQLGLPSLSNTFGDQPGLLTFKICRRNAWMVQPAYSN
jgi:hypothetical protein